MRPGLALAMLVATMGGIGRLRPGPGTWGSALVLPAVLLGSLGCLALAVVLAVAGFWATYRVLGEDTAADPAWVVVDEGAGQLLVLAALPAGAGFWGIVLAFLLFRFLDILKPGPVGWADRRHGAVGVMLDDLVAGVIAAALVLLLRAAFPEIPL
ncbi:phosphatidylglycerophosphatase A [Siccirubricoccus deserti]|uniref:Phosphatidylglycerophosphatase A n=1 Tax=Siccirubricoccus deserti TaxID=2013562 RepID=A0A9X0R1M1_9PROT|nr:phosphatidylglycerophosphatase A [Siccirubricoccus deserti]MBC4017670.1 phosphatidylglycerophosphatase A [Siccirubricoccus deserti]GGC55529.1 phosphatidylglycerophosphatase A [Siccirubricoccus deserti]